MELKRTKKICETCSKIFEVRNCYLKRLYKNGRFCSNKCRNIGFIGTGNPKASKYAIYGSKVSKHKRHLAYYQRSRQQALEKLARVWNTTLVCSQCACSIQSVLQVNHLQDFKTKQSGAKLWRLVLSLPDLEAKERFDIRCSLCNWKHFLERKYSVQYNIEWRGEGAR